MTKHEKIAARNIKAAFNFEVGGVYNAYQDGEDINITLEEMKDIVYDVAMNDLYGPGTCLLGRAPREMRFAGKEFCRNYIDKLFAEDSDVAEIPWLKLEKEREKEN